MFGLGWKNFLVDWVCDIMNSNLWVGSKITPTQPMYTPIKNTIFRILKPDFQSFLPILKSSALGFLSNQAPIMAMLTGVGFSMISILVGADTFMNLRSLNGQIGNFSSLIILAATLGALGYGYMRWKGFSFSDPMFDTKRNMANAGSSLTKNLENVTDALAATKRQLTQRIGNLDDKMLKQMEVLKLMKDDVEGVKESVSRMNFELGEMRHMISGLIGQVSSLEYKLDLANAARLYMCNLIEGKKVKMPNL